MHDLSAVAGRWFIPNPDRGQRLPDSRARIITGGQYEIDASGGVKVRLQRRDARGTVDEIELGGRVESANQFLVRIAMQGNLFETFEIIDTTTLRRRVSNIGTQEHSIDLVLQKKFDVPHQPERPSILFNTMPKSGSIYLTNWLAGGLGLEETKVAVCLFPDDFVIRDKFDRFVAGGKICQQHLPANDLNLRFIADRDPRVVVHVRDPRQATVSWTYHLDNFYEQKDTVPACKLGLEAVSPALPADYFSRTFEERLDYQLRVHFPQLIAWTEGWVEAADRRAHGIDVAFTTFENFKHDPKSVVSRVLAHYKIPESTFDWSAAPQASAETHYRKGETSEWKSLLSDAQKTSAAKQISQTLAARFDWQV